MKKVFVLLCSVLPGGFLLLMVLMLFTGCARFQYETSAKNRIRGITASPETMMMADAEAYATRKCADDPTKCRAAEIAQLGQFGAWGGMYGAGAMDTPAGYTWAGIRAVAAYGSGISGGSNPPQGNDGELRKDVARIKKSLGLTIQAIKKGN